MHVVFVEGVDGAGKTTLVKNAKYKYETLQFARAALKGTAPFSEDAYRQYREIHELFLQRVREMYSPHSVIFTDRSFVSNLVCQHLFTTPGILIPGANSTLDVYSRVKSSDDYANFVNLCNDSGTGIEFVQVVAPTTLPPHMADDRQRVLSNIDGEISSDFLHLAKVNSKRPKEPPYATDANSLRLLEEVTRMVIISLMEDCQKVKAHTFINLRSKGQPSAPNARAIEFLRVFQPNPLYIVK